MLVECLFVYNNNNNNNNNKTAIMIIILQLVFQGESFINLNWKSCIPGKHPNHHTI